MQKWEPEIGSDFKKNQSRKVIYFRTRFGKGLERDGKRKVVGGEILRAVVWVYPALRGRLPVASERGVVGWPAGLFSASNRFWT